MAAFKNDGDQFAGRGDSEDRGLRQSWDVVDKTNNAMSKFRPSQTRAELLRLPEMTSENRSLFDSVLGKISDVEQEQAQATAARVRQHADEARERLQLSSAQRVFPKRVAGKS